MTKPVPPLYVGGGPVNFKRIARLKAGWIAITPLPELLAGPLEELRAVAGSDVPVTRRTSGARNRRRKPLPVTRIWAGSEF